MGKYKAVLFDFDGTLMDTNDIIMASWQYTFMKYRGKEGDRDWIISTYGEVLAVSMEKAFPDIPLEECMDTYRDYQRDIYLEKIHLFDGMEELIRKLHDGGYKLAIVTSRLKSSLERGLDKYDLRKYFDAIVTCEDCEEHKPLPGPCLAALEKLNLPASDAVMVGDSVFDVLCAKNAGVDSIMVGWAMDGAGNCANASETEAEYFAPTAEDIFKIVEG